MRITFIKPSMTPGRARDALEPLVFGLLAALTPAGDRIRFYDERIEPIPFDEPADLVALSVDTYSARRAYQITTRYRGRGIPVVMGGCHPTLCTAEALRHADCVVAGDAEDTWPALLADARAGRLQPHYQSQFPPLGGLRIDRSLFAGKRYGPLRLVQAGRGCPHACDFCSVHAFYGRRLRYRPLAEVIAEIEALGARPFVFTDDNLFADPAAAIPLLERLRPLRRRWSCQATLDVAADPALVRLMAAAGCLSVTVGLESLQDANLAQMRKAPSQRSGRYEEWVRTLHRHGIMVYGSFMFGYDRDTPRAFAPALDFALRLRLFLANFNPLVPMPGTALHARLQSEGRLIRDPWWLDPDFRYGDAVFHPRGMTAGELTAGIFQARRRFNRFGSILRRGLNLRANARTLYNAGTYLAVNLVNRREVFRKQGQPLGHPLKIADDEMRNAE